VSTNYAMAIPEATTNEALVFRKLAGNGIKNRQKETHRPPRGCPPGTWNLRHPLGPEAPNLSLLIQLAASPKELSSGLLERHGDGDPTSILRRWQGRPGVREQTK
jgi:hypothetical protein